MRRCLWKLIIANVCIILLSGCATTSNMSGDSDAVLDKSGFATDVRHTMIADSTKIHGESNIFLNDTPEIVYYAIFPSFLNFQGLIPTKRFTVEWIDPEGNIYFKERVGLVYCSNRLVISKLKVRGTLAMEKFGLWTCRFYRSGELLDEKKFQLESPTVREKRLVELERAQEDAQIDKIKETFNPQAGIVYKASAPQSEITQLVKENDKFVALIVIVNENQDMIGTGSGFLVGSDGLVATNYHVIKNAKGGAVKFPNKEIFVIESIEAVDPIRDLALIKVDYANKEYAKLGDSDIINVGEEVIAISSPFALTNSVSNGLISSIRHVNEDLDLIQISVPISPGSSGGALFNISGEIIGMTSAGIRPDTAQNINFAIPINYICRLMDDRNPIPLKIDNELKIRLKGYQQFKNDE